MNTFQRRWHSLRQARLGLILALFALLATISSLVVPPFETPDEIWHFAVIQQLASGGGLPVSEPNTTALWRQQGGQAPGYYLAAAALTFWIDQSDFPALYARANPYVTIGLPELLNRSYLIHQPEGWPWRGSILALHLVRFFSVGLSVVTLWATYQTLALLLDRERALLGTAIFAFVPQFIFISGAASNDNAINALAALLIWRLVALLRAAPASPTSSDAQGLLVPWQRPRPYVVIGLLLGLAILAKLSGSGLILLVSATLGLIAWRARRWAPLVQGGVLVGGVAAVISGWWFARNWLLYGDVVALNIWRSNILLRGRPAEWHTIVNEWESLDHSFWGLFGWFNIVYPTWLYRLFQGLELVIILGVVAVVVRRIIGWRRGTVPLPAGWRLLGVGLLGLWLVNLTVGWLGYMLMAPAAQGRYFHPAAPTLALGMSVGLTGLGALPWRRWLPASLAVRAPRLPRTALGWLVACGLCGLSALTPWWLIRPAYQPAQPVAALPGDATPLGIRFGESMVLEGYTLRADGPFAPSQPFELTFYWRALRPLDEPLAVAVKVFGRDDDLLSRDDSFPDAGRWPTTAWQPGVLIPDRKKLWLSGKSEVPALAHMTVDVYRLLPNQASEMLPATKNGEPVATLPYAFHEMVVREAGAAPVPPADFKLRPVVHKREMNGNLLALFFEWEVGQPVEQDLQAFLHLTLAMDQPPVAQDDFAPLDGGFPSRFWLPGDRLQEYTELELPDGLAEGTYLVVMGLYNLQTGERLIGEGTTSAWVVGKLHWDGLTWHDAETERLALPMDGNSSK